jgi:DNA-binding CsgD family transcriptional regulator
MTDDEWVANILAKTPPMTPNQRNRLALILSGNNASEQTAVTDLNGHRKTHDMLE